MAICRGSREPKIEYPPVEFYHFSKKQFKAGISKTKIKGHEISIYNPEKLYVIVLDIETNSGLI